MGAPGSSSRPFLTLVLLLSGVALVFVAQFALSSWAETTPVHHEVQHGLIFMAGIAVGAGATVLARLGRSPRSP
ncbi:MAG: hypothetical protein ACYDD4_13815 [Acidimicrobiales bacterium]